MDKAAITAALKTLREERARIEEGIIVLERLMREVPSSGRGPGRPAGGAGRLSGAGEAPKRQISAAARRKMAAAQKRRWAAFRAAQKNAPAAAKKSTKKAPARQE
jgi:hypothetical protein